MTIRPTYLNYLAVNRLKLQNIIQTKFKKVIWHIFLSLEIFLNLSHLYSLYLDKTFEVLCTLKFQIITYLVVPRLSRSCDSHFDLTIVHLIEIFHIGDRIHLEISMRIPRLKIKCQDFKSNLQIYLLQISRK